MYVTIASSIYILSRKVNKENTVNKMLQIFRKNVIAFVTALTRYTRYESVLVRRIASFSTRKRSKRKFSVYNVGKKIIFRGPPVLKEDRI